MEKILADRAIDARQPDLRMTQVGTPIRLVPSGYAVRMHNKHHNDLPPELERYLRLCQRIYERMKLENSWPWRDSTESEDLVDSEGNPNDI